MDFLGFHEPGSSVDGSSTPSLPPDMGPFAMDAGYPSPH
ncbi:hypothetical protein KIPB_014246, partial [Kipferlia bialata]|eukprot:g14246.t1